MNIKDFIKAHELEFDTWMVNENPNLVDAWDAYHYEVTIYGKSKEMVVYFSMGKGRDGHPTLEKVLECLRLDADVLDRTFEEWASDLGYSSDSIKALKRYKITKTQTNKLKRFLGLKAFSELLQCEEAYV